MDSAKRHEAAFKTLLVAAGLGIVGNLLIRDVAWGIGFSIFAAVVFGAALLLNRNKQYQIAPGTLWVGVGTLGFAALLAWRDAPELKVLNGICMFLLVGLLALRAHWGQIRIATVTDYPFRLIGKCFQMLGDTFFLANLEGGWSKLSGERKGRTFLAVGRGLMLAVPLVFLFGGLFISADAGFEKMITNAVSFSPKGVTSGILVSFACFWVIAGLFRRLFLATDPPPVPAEEGKVTGSYGILEISTALVMVNLLFAMFVAVQFKHFFGGDAVVQNTAGLGYADYARRGFFELATASVLVLPVLLGANALLKRDTPLAGRVYNILAGLLVGLVMVVMFSAVERMRLYVGMYGISQLRIYVLASIGWIGAVFVWFAVTVLRRRYHHFAFGALVLFLVSVVGLNFLNPDGMVARINTSRTDRTIDVGYLSVLSADAVPALVEALPRLSSPDATKLRESLEARGQWLAREDWRSWTVSRSRAMGSLQRLDALPVAMR
jgi:hypothetical protein